MALVALWLAVQWARLRSLLASAKIPSETQIQNRFAQLAGRLQIRRAVRLLVGPEDTVPCTFGLLRPVVVVPCTLARTPSEDLDRVLAHELAHHRRGDLWVNACQLALFAVWWFHPLYWLLHRSLRATREDCCDDLLLAMGITLPGDYCETILRVATDQGSTRPLVVASSMADYPHPLERRFRRIMDGSLRRSMHLGWLGLAAVLVLAVVLLPGARGSADVEEAASPDAIVARPESSVALPDTKAASSNKATVPGQPRTVHGRVVDQSRKPLPGVKLWLPVGWTPDGSVIARGTADERGFFQLEVPKEWMNEPRFHRSLYTVWAYAPGHTVGIAPAYYNLFGENSDSIVLKLDPERQTSITVVAPDGSPAVGATVVPFRCMTTAVSMFVPDELAAILSTTTDKNGCTRLSAFLPHDIRYLAVTTKEFGCQLMRPESGMTANEPWRIQLRPTGKVVGQIACDDPDAVAGARLTLETYGDPVPPHTSMPPWITEGHAVVVTDDRGRFTVEQMAAGRLHVVGTLPNEGRHRLWIPDWYDVTEGETTVVTLETRTGVPVTGIVVEEETQKPIPGVRVRLSPYGRSQGAYATTDDKGRYSTYSTPGVTGYSATAYDYSRSPNDSSHTSVEIPKDTERFEMPTIRMVPVATTRVFRGRLVDSEGHGVPHGRVRAYLGNTIHRQAAGSGNTDANGDFHLAGVPLDATLSRLTFQVTGFRHQPIPAELIQEDPLVLRVVPLSEETGTRITGRVIDQRGEPVEGAAFRIDARRDRTNQGWSVVHFSHQRPLVRTDESGRFQTPVFYLRGWQYQVTVESPLRQSAYGTSEWRTANDSKTDLGDIRVNRRFSVRGRVVDESGKPIEGAIVSVPCDDTKYTETTDAGGRFAFKNVFGHGRFQFKIVADGYQAYEELTPFSKEDGERHDGGPTIVLLRQGHVAKPPVDDGTAGNENSSHRPTRETMTSRPGEPRTIEGRVMTASGEPVEDATVTLPNWGDKAPLAVSQTKADGTFSLVFREDSNLPHRRSHPLCISAKGFAATYVHQRHLTVFPGGREDLGDIRVFPGEIFHGRVVDPAGNPIAGAKITCSTVRYELGHTCAEVGLPYETTTDSQGRYETHRMPLGSRWVMVQAEGFQLAVLDEEVFRRLEKRNFRL